MNIATLYRRSIDGNQETTYGLFLKEEIKELKKEGWGFEPCPDKRKQYNKNGILIDNRLPRERS